MRPAHSYQSPSMTPPDEPEVGDEECEIDDCPYMALLERELCQAHTQEQAEDEEADRRIERMNDYGYQYPKGFDGR